MEKKEQSPPQSGKQHRRAKIACTNCNARRVRCSAYQGQPCSNCQRLGAPCELIVSRRGKYDRSQTKGLDRRPSMALSNDSSSRPVKLTNGSTNGDYTNRNASSTPTSESDTEPAEDTSGNPMSDTGGMAEGSEMLFARLAESDTRPETSKIINTGRTVYLGEPFSLAFVVQRVCDPNAVEPTGTKMHFAIPDNVDEKARNLYYDTKLEREEREFLRSRGVFEVPERSISDRLIRVYFDCVHPAWPVFDRDKFARLYLENKLSLLVLQIVYFLAVTLCDEQLLLDAGFKTRYKARIAFYNRAKALYHADQEKDKVTLVSALFLMGFWWGGPVDEKDTWHWLGDSIGLAQTMGMHRSTARSDMSIKDRRLWKRIWWSLYVRDRHAAAALGRPVRTRDEDCDVEPLEESDFEEEGDADPMIFGTPMRYHVLYAMNMSKLGMILGKVVTSHFGAVRTTTLAEDEGLTVSLRKWEEDLPPEMRYQPPGGDLGPAFWSSMLHFSYTNTSVLLHRPKSVMELSERETEREAYAIVAADKTTRMVEDLLAAGTFRCAQLHLVPSLFAALTVHAILIRRGDPVRRQLAENRSRQCMLGLSELSKSWPVGGWILQLFLNLMQRLTGRDFTIEKKRPTKRKRSSQVDSHVEWSNGTIPHHQPGPYPTPGGLPGLPHEGSSEFHSYRGALADESHVLAQPHGHGPSPQQTLHWSQDQPAFDFLLQDSFASFFSSGNNEWYSPEEINGASMNGASIGHA